MKYAPILFSAPMVQAILEGKKTMTRRVIKNKVLTNGFDVDVDGSAIDYEDCFGGHHRPEEYAPHQPGDILWVRETWQETDVDCAGGGYDLHTEYVYKSTFEPTRGVRTPDTWRPSIFMPKAASRIFLRVTDVRVDRIQNICMNGIQAEGAVPDGVVGGTVHQWRNDYWIPLWDSINAKRGYGWDKNPWVWVYTFERADKPERWPLCA